MLCVLVARPAFAQIDFTGEWAPLYHEDSPERLPGPELGDYLELPINEAARMRAESYDADRISVVQEYQCRPHGADYALRIDTDEGMQTRLLHFDGKPPANAGPSWQGYSVANWEKPPRGPGTPAPGLGAVRQGLQGRAPEVVTTQLRSGYLRKNGAPYSANAVVREFYDLFTERNGDTWFVVTTVVEDPTYLTEPFVTSSNFKKQPNASGFNPTPCSAR